MAILGRNSQAQYYQSGGEGLETIKPLSAQYGLMGRPKQSETPEIERESVNGLFQQAKDYESLGDDIQSSLNNAVTKLDNLSSKYGSMQNALSSEEGKELQKELTAIAETRRVYSASKATVDQNFASYKQDMTQDNNKNVNRVAIRGNGLVLDDGGVGMELSFGELFSIDKDIKANQLLTVGESANRQNNYTRLFDEKKNIIQYKPHVIINEDANKKWHDFFASNRGVVERSRGRANTEGDSDYKWTVNTTNSNSENIESIIDELDASLGYISSLNNSGIDFTSFNPSPLMDSESMNYLFDEYVKTLKTNGRIPIVSFSPIRQEIEVEDENGKKSTSEVVTGFEVIPTKDDDGKVMYTDAVNSKVGFQSFITMRAISILNPQIDIMSEISRKSSAIAATGQQKEEFADWGEHINAIMGKVSPEDLNLENLFDVQENSYLRMVRQLYVDKKDETKAGVIAYLGNTDKAKNINKNIDKLGSLDMQIRTAMDELELVGGENVNMDKLNTIKELIDEQNKIAIETLDGLSNAERKSSLFAPMEFLINNIEKEIYKAEALFGYAPGGETSFSIYGISYNYKTDQDFMYGNTSSPRDSKGRAFSLNNREIHVGSTNAKIKLPSNTSFQETSFQRMIYAAPDYSHKYKGKYSWEFGSDEEKALWARDAKLTGHSGKQYQQSIIRGLKSEFETTYFQVKAQDGTIVRITGKEVLKNDDYKKQVGIVPSDIVISNRNIEPDADIAKEDNASEKYVWFVGRSKVQDIQRNSYGKPIKDYESIATRISQIK